MNINTFLLSYVCHLLSFLNPFQTPSKFSRFSGLASGATAQQYEVPRPRDRFYHFHTPYTFLTTQTFKVHHTSKPEIFLVAVKPQ